MPRQPFVRNLRGERGHEAFEHERRLPGSRNTGDDGETVLRHTRIQRVHGMQWRGLDVDRAFAEHVVRRRLRPHDLRMFVREERRDERMRVLFDVLDRALCDHSAAVRARSRPHFDDPIGLAQHTRIVVDDDDRVPLRLEVTHDADESIDVRRMQADRRFVEHIHRTRQFAAHGARELDALPFSRRQRRSRTIERQVSETEFEETARGAREFVDDRLRHVAHVVGHRSGYRPHPFVEFVELHRALFGQRLAVHGECTRAFVETCPVAVGARFLFDERLDALESLRVFRFVERIEHGARGAEVGEVHFARAVLLLQVVHDVPFFRGPVQHNLFFVGGEVFVRYVGAHAHLAAHVHHDRPHQ